MSSIHNLLPIARVLLLFSSQLVWAEIQNHYLFQHSPTLDLNNTIVDIKTIIPGYGFSSYTIIQYSPMWSLLIASRLELLVATPNATCVTSMRWRTSASFSPSPCSWLPRYSKCSTLSRASLPTYTLPWPLVSWPFSQPCRSACQVVIVGYDRRRTIEPCPRTLLHNPD